MPADSLDQFAAFGIWYAVFLFTLTFHEGAHSLLAHWGGDDTAYHGGQVSLNPWPHIRREPFGTVIFPIMTFFLSGWMMGWASAPYDRAWGRRYPGRLAAMSAAGPAANLILAAVSFVILKMTLAAGYFVAPERLNMSHLVAPASGGTGGTMAAGLALCLSVGLSLNVLLGLFNLIPLPPLDGSGIVQGLFPESLGKILERFASSPMSAILSLVVAMRLFGFLSAPIFSLVVDLLHPGLYR